jgi:hypothetical protein
MARRVFFGFHYERDIWRACQVRNSWVTQPDRESAGFWDSASWEAVKKKGEDAVKRWIRDQIKGTSVTVVLIGTKTSTRKYVQYEIEHSWEVGNGLIGIYIHNLEDDDGNTDSKGDDPFVALGYKNIRTYDWVNDKGYNNLGDWVEAAYKRAQKRKK